MPDFDVGRLGKYGYRFLSERIGPLEGLVRVETAPVVRVLKRTGLVTAS